MIKKRYMVMGILAFCLTTALFIGVVTSGKKPNPVWTAIFELQTNVDSLNASFIELQSEVDSVEEELNQVKTIRFLEPTEYILTQNAYEWTTIKTFTWTPDNGTNNAILDVAYYAEYQALKTLGYDLVVPMWRIMVDDKANGYQSFTLYENVTDYTWIPLYDWAFQSKGIEPNQASYAIKFQIAVQHGTVYFRNLNVIVTVADGLPATN